MTSEALTTADVAERLGLQPRSVVKLIKRGKIQARRFGHLYAIEPAEVERYERERRGAGRPKQQKDES